MAAAHPLDPLTKAELANAAAIVGASKSFPTGGLYAMIALREPDKAKLLAWKPGREWTREAEVVVLDRKANRTYQGIVDLGGNKLTAWNPLPGKQSLVLFEEYGVMPRIVKADPRWQAAMKKRGITDFGKVWIDVWANGHLVPKGQEGARLLRGVSFLRDGAVNFYGRPIEGVIAIVNMNTEKVVDVIDTGVVPISPSSQQLDEKSIGTQRKVAPLVPTSPDGPSYQVDGHAIRWQKWHLRWAMHPRDGLVLYAVDYDDAGKRRSVLYRGGLSEMVVPYGDTDATWVWRAAFDQGEYGVGRLAGSLEPEQDAPPGATFFDADFSDDHGEPYTVKNAVGLYERDGGILWKHYDSETRINQSRRARELVVFFVVSIGNYDYVVQWIFRQDGSLAVDVALTGIMLAKGSAAVRADHDHGASHGHLVARNIVAPHHQHFFNFRLDLDVDGSANSVAELNTMATDSPEHNAIQMQETVLASEQAAQRDVDMASARMWKIFDPAHTTALGYHPGYLLVPGQTSLPYLTPAARVRQRAPFVNHHFWVTRYKVGELYAAGDYPNQAEPGDGIERYSADDESLAGKDLVTWYTMGVTHIPRPEEWPVMPTHHIGFTLLPAAFFDRNPALDVPR